MSSVNNNIPIAPEYPEGMVVGITDDKIVNNKSIGAKLKDLIIKVAKFIGRVIGAILMIGANCATLGAVNAVPAFRRAYAPIFLGRPAKTQTPTYSFYKQELVGRFDEVKASLKPVPKNVRVEQEIKSVRRNLKHVNPLHNELLLKRPELRQVPEPIVQLHVEDKTTTTENMSATVSKVVDAVQDHPEETFFLGAFLTGLGVIAFAASKAKL